LNGFSYLLAYFILAYLQAALFTVVWRLSEDYITKLGVFG